METAVTHVLNDTFDVGIYRQGWQELIDLYADKETG